MQTHLDAQALELQGEGKAVRALVIVVPRPAKTQKLPAAGADRS